MLNIPKIIVTKGTLPEISKRLMTEKVLAIDTETTGLRAYQGHRVFSIIITSEVASYYFNLNHDPDHLGGVASSICTFRPEDLAFIGFLLDRKEVTFYAHNAKFDIHMLSFVFMNCEFKARIVCTEATARLINNTLPNYKLASLGKLIGHEKDDSVEKYISKHKLYTNVDVGKKKPRQDKHYNLVPFDIISNYGMQDGIVTLHLGKHIENRILDLSKQFIEMGLPDIKQVFNQEIALTKVLYRMEKKGVKIDVEYCKEAYEYHIAESRLAAEVFYCITGIDFQDSPTVLRKAYEAAGYKTALTPKGNPTFADKVLPDDKLSALVRKYRKNYKKAITYYRNLIDLADENGFIHCDFKQSGALTGRMSCMSPNLQNIPKRGEDDSKYPVRRAFIPFDDNVLGLFDYDQMEYRKLLDDANEKTIINAILNDGLEVHSATAKEMDVNRDEAKTLNFKLLYGSGAKAVGIDLGISLQAAKALIYKYFFKLPRVKGLLQAIKTTSKSRGYIVNFMGRMLLCGPNDDYKMPNHYIQGSCGDTVKAAMIKIDSIILENNLKSYMILQVHDELILYIYPEEKHLFKDIPEIMERAYKHKNLPLTAGADYSKVSWQDKKVFGIYPE